MADERAPLLPSNTDEAAAAAPRQLPFWKRKRVGLWALTGLLIGVVAGGVIYLVVRDAGKGQTKYPGESITWSPCGEVAGKPVECSNLTVPMDHFNASRSANHTFMIPLIRRRGGANATTNLLLNPGGPGGSGLDFIHRKGGAIHTIVGEDRFHLLSFDPRGIEGSRPRAQCFDDDDARAALTPRESGDAAQDLRLWGDMGNFMRACADNMGPHAAHVNTPQTAADMNSILDAVGQEHMYYWGFSYGSALGQTYATLFPERSEAVIVDGVVDNFLWYDSLLMETDFTDTANALSGFYDECVKAGSKCPLHFVADNKKDLERNVTSFIEGLQEDPVSVYVNSTYFGTVDYVSMIGAGFTAMYKPAGWYEYADNLAQLMQGNGTAAFAAYKGLPEKRASGRQSGRFVEYNDAPAGPSRWPAERGAVVDIVKGFIKRNEPYGASDAAHYLGRAQWPVEKAHDPNKAVRQGVETRRPLLVLSTTYDPICPLVNAKVARDAFVGARLVEVKTYGHCSLAMPSKCLAGHVRRFLTEGVLPEKEHSKCEAEGPYFIKPGENDDKHKGKVQALGLAVDEDEALMQALRDMQDAIEPMARRF